MLTKAQRQKSYKRGLAAESLAMLYLLAKGYRPLSTRYKTPVGEIDLIMKRGNMLVFVEVKHRAKQLDAAHAVHAHNRSRVVRAAQYYLSAHPDLTSHQVRFDVCLLTWYRLPHHIPHAFDAA